jgi:hypothetical protein
MNVEWLILADGAQTVGNKLFLLGGGWDVLTVTTSLPVNQHMAVATSFLVPWSETNMKHNFEIEIVHEDGASIAKVGGQFEVGRPPGIPVGSNQRSQIAIDMTLLLEKGGIYVIKASVEGEERAKTTFRVVGGRAAGAAGP